MFTCDLNLTDGWIDNQSFQLSTTNGTENKWSWIAGKEIEVKPNQQYEFLTHMKLDQWANQSHIPLEAFESSDLILLQFQASRLLTDIPSAVDECVVPLWCEPIYEPTISKKIV